MSPTKGLRWLVMDWLQWAELDEIRAQATLTYIKELEKERDKYREALETIREWEYRSTHDTGKTLVEQECENALAEDKEGE